MTKVYLVRHAEAEGNLYRRAQGHYNSTITERGYRQIAALAERFKNVHIDAVYASDLWRTRTTALSICMPHGLPLNLAPEFREVCMGIWEDKTWSQIEFENATGLRAFNTDAANWSIEGGETLMAVRDRALAKLRELIAKHDGETIAIFSHGMCLRMLVGTLQGLTLSEIDKTHHAENTAVNYLECENGEIRVVYRDDASHLTDELSTLRGQAWLKSKNGFEGGIRFEKTAEEGAFAVVLDGKSVGRVSIARIDGSVAEIGEDRLDEAHRGQGVGIRLLGQALSYARKKGCDTLRIRTRDELGKKRAAQYDFTCVGEENGFEIYEKVFRYEDTYCRNKLRRAMEYDGK